MMMSRTHETNIRTPRRVARRAPRVASSSLSAANDEVPLQVMVPASVRRRVGVLSAERGENLRTTILRGLVAIGVDVPEAELVDRRGRKRQE